MNGHIRRLVAGFLCLMLLVCMLPARYHQKAVAASYGGGMAGSGQILAHGLDVSAWQESGLNFQNIANAGYKYVILRCGTSYGKDKCFEEYYANAKAAGLDVGCYFYSYALNTATAQQEAREVLSWIKGKVFEYPVYFDFEDPTQIDLSYTLSAQICRGFMDIMKENGYLAGLYSMSWILSRDWITTSGIRDTYEGWVAHVYSDANNTGITSNEYNIYKDRYASVYGMHQYSFTTYVNGVGPFDANVCYKDYPSIVKAAGLNGYNGNGWVEDAAFDPVVYRGRYPDLRDRTDQELKDHWLAFGIKEGRCASSVLDLKYYLEQNPDLQKAFGTDYEAAYQHFITTGYQEYRKSSPLFDGQYYCDQYPDVAAGYKEKYLLHYLEHGMKEGRRGSATFDVQYYLFIRPDVAEMFPDDLAMAARHYAGYGIYEGKGGYDDVMPVISDVTVSNITEDGYTVSCKVTDNWEVSQVSFPTWTVANGQDDLAENFMNTQLGTKKGDTYTFQVKASDHNGDGGYYATHIYAQDRGGNVVSLELDPIEVTSEPDQITLISKPSHSIEQGYLMNVKERTTVKNLLGQFENNVLEVVDCNGNVITGSATVGTGAKINLRKNDKIIDTVTIVISGDIDGNGLVDTTDYLQIKTTFLEGTTLTGAQKIAADVDGSNTVDTTDYMRIKAAFLQS